MKTTRHIPEERLAAYFDGELAPDERQAVEKHLTTCVDCRRLLADQALAREGMAALPPAPEGEDLWDRIEPSLAPRRPSPTRVPHLRPHRLAAAVIGVLVLALAVWSWTARAPGTGLPVVSAAAPFNLGPYLQALDHAGKLPAMPAAYRQRPVSAQEALRAIAQAVEVDLQALPSGLRLQEASLITYEGARMAQLVFVHQRGMVLLFVQPRDYAVSFAHFSAEPTVVRTRRCLSVRCGDYRALCFSTRRATYTVVGRFGDPALEAFIQAISTH